MPKIIIFFLQTLFKFNRKSLLAFGKKWLEYTENSFTSIRLVNEKAHISKPYISTNTPSNHFWWFNKTYVGSYMFNSLGRHACRGLDWVDFHRVCSRSYYTDQFQDLRINVSLTDAVLTLYFIPWRTDASERSLQILTGTGRTRTGKGYTLISILKEKWEKLFKYEVTVAKWHKH